MDSFFQIQRADGECITIGGGNVCIAVVHITAPGVIQGHSLATARRHHTAVLNSLPLRAVLPRDLNYRLQVQRGKRYRIVIGYGRRTNGLRIPFPRCALGAHHRSRGVTAHKSRFKFQAGFWGNGSRAVLSNFRDGHLAEIGDETECRVCTRTRDGIA